MATTKQKKPLPDVYGILRKKYPAAEYALMKEVSDAAGFSRSRSADYVVMSFWPSRGLAISGIEVKSFRGDWLNEKKNPEKAENIFQYCDYFWLLTTDETVANLNEIPESWGWMCIKGTRIVIMKDAPKLDPKDVSHHFMAAMLKRACDKTEFIHKSQIEDRIEYEKETAVNSVRKEYQHLQKEYDSLKSDVEKFNKTSGINLRSYYRWQTDAEEIGKAVKFLTGGGAVQLRKELEAMEPELTKIYTEFGSVLKTIKAISLIEKPFIETTA